MRSEVRPEKVGRMAADRHPCLTIEFDPNADPISGVLRDGAGGGARFVGWMALTRAIELAVEAARHASVQDSPEVPLT
jgi:hypothetical protein